MTSKQTKIIAISRDNGLAERVKKLFPDKNISVSWDRDVNNVVKKFKSETYDIIILTSTVFEDGKMQQIEVLETIKSKSPATQILVMVEAKDIHIAMNALRIGTFQYTKLPVDDEELQLLISTALERKPQFGTNQLLKNKDREDRFEKMVGRSAPMQQVYQQLRQAASTDIPVLLMGETGTGKDLAAQAIHRQSARNKGPYLPVNLGAIPSELVASELFGHEKGAFTGAVTRHKGKFEQGNNGTVFLDEIDAIDEKVQISLLRLIEFKKFHRLGGKRPIYSNVHLIAATNSNLEELVRQGNFREDLFFRLDVFRIVVPPLRQRYGDIPLLVDEFLLRFNQSFKKNILGIAPECIQMLEGYDWPGNVRELKNVIQRAVLICEGDEIRPKHLPPRFQKERSSKPTVTFEIGTPLDKVEREMIIRALRASENNRTQAAELLGISRRAIYNKLKKHNID